MLRIQQAPAEAEILAVRASALESNAVRAGAALGCCYANSHEYEAELIAARRAAGAYAPKQKAWKARVVMLAAGLCAIGAGLLLLR